MSFRSRKRARVGAVVVQTRQVRPIDKNLINIAIVNGGTTQRQTNIKTTTFPCTIVGLRWSLSFKNIEANLTENFYWVIAVVPDGVVISNLGTGSGGDLYTPEQHVLAFGQVACGRNDASGTYIQNIEGSTKTMRKLSGGDVVMFGVLGLVGTGTQVIRGTIQFFCKS